MTDYDRDRGAYTPSGETPLAFDPRAQGAGRPPTTLIVSAVILLVLVIGVFVYYRAGVRHAGEPPVVGQPLGAIKQPAPSSAQPTDESAGLSIYKAEEAPAGAAPATPKFAPPPEEPKPLPVTRLAQPAPAAKADPALKGPASLADTTAATGDTTPAVAPTPPRAPAPAVAAPAASAAPGGGKLVQIGAFSSPALAHKGWNDIARLMPGDMVGRTETVEPVSKDGQTLYRAYIGGFGSKADAASFCGQLKAQGRSCFVK